jgi:hypothetical protein
MKQQESTLGAEPVTFNDSVEIACVCGEMKRELDPYGGARMILTLTGSCPTTEISQANIIEEQFATVRGIRMKIASASVGLAMTEIEFEAPNKTKK